MADLYLMRESRDQQAVKEEIDPGYFMDPEVLAKKFGGFFPTLIEN